MSTLKQVIHYTDTNSVEATWVDENDVVIKCHSYADVQMDMFKADILNFGGDPTDQSDLIALVESNIKPVEPEPIPVPQEISKAQGIAVMSKVPVGESNLWLAVKAYFDTEADEISRDLFYAIQVFNRQSPMLNNLKWLFGLDDAALDKLFIEGARVIV